MWSPKTHLHNHHRSKVFTRPYTQSLQAVSIQNQNPPKNETLNCIITYRNKLCISVILSEITSYSISLEVYHSFNDNDRGEQ